MPCDESESVYACICTREGEERVHACVYIVYNSDLRHWTAINVINERESLTILILSRCNRNNKVLLYSHSALSFLSSSIVPTLSLFHFLPLLVRDPSCIFSNAKLMALKSSKDVLVSRIFLDPALTINLQIRRKLRKR